MLGNFFNPGSNSVLNKIYRHQLTGGITATLITFSYGISSGWISPMLLRMKSDDSPVPFTITVEEASWIGSLMAIGGMCGNVFFGFLLDTFGRKMGLYLLAIPHAILWIMIYFANEVYHLYIARFIGGLTGGGVFIVIPIFVAEIADPRVRGALGSLLCLSINGGILSGYIIATLVPYYVIPCIIFLLPLIFVLLVTQYPETPNYLLGKGLTNKAEKSLKFYRNIQIDDKEGLQKLKSDFAELKMSIQLNSNKQKVSLSDFSGFGNDLLNYSSMIFAESGSTMDPNTNTIIIGVMQFIGTYCATIFVDRYGRKILLLLSTSGMFMGLTLLGTFSYVAHNIDIDLSSFTWMPLVLLSFVIYSANIGVVAVTFVVLVEILPPKIRSLGSTLFMLCMSIFSFTSLKLFPVLMASIGVAGVMWICGGVAVFGFCFILTFIKETKGKSIDKDSDFEKP